MSLVVEKLSLRNFERYRKAEINFSTGLNLIRGRNSTGKTTILNALTFAFFGEIPDADPKLLVSRLPGSGGMTLYIKFRSPRTGQIVEVERRGGLDKNGNYRTESRVLRVDGRNVSINTEEELKYRISELLGMTLRKFTDLVYIRQGVLNNILKPDRDHMDSILGITLLKEIYMQFDDVRRELEKFDGRDVSTELRILEEHMPKNQSYLKDVEADISRLEKEINEKEEALKKAESPELNELLKDALRKENVEEMLKATYSQIQMLLKQVGALSPEELETRIKLCEEKIEELRKESRIFEEEAKHYGEKWSNARAQIRNLMEQLETREELAEKGFSKCPTCGQDLNPSILRKMVEEDRTKLRGLEDVESELKKIKEEKDSELKSILEELKKVENDYSMIRRIRSSLEEALGNRTRLLNEISGLVEKIDEKLSALNILLSPEDPDLRLKLTQYLPIQPEERERIRSEVKEKRRTLEDKLRTRNRLLRDIENDTRLMSELKKRIEKASLARMLAQSLEKAIEDRRRELLRRIGYKALDYYRAMTDQHVYDDIKIDPENYSVWVHPSGLTEFIPANRVGGGHQSIISLAVRLAILHSLGLGSLLILDEPTYGVDSQNLPQVASYIGKASKYLSQMILVTHHEICEEEASNIIETTFQEDGSSKAEIRMRQSCFNNI
ncbi:MAG: AAA family ATPase [Thermoproteota archaeon]